MDEKKNDLELEISVGDKKKLIRADILLITRKQAFIKAFITFGSSVFLAFLSSFIPLVHFFAVPLFLLFAPIAAVIFYKTYHNQKNLCFKSSVKCPNCLVKLKVPKSYELYPLNDICFNCKVRFKLNEKY